MTTQFQVADTRKSTSLIKKYLQSKFGVKFSVKTDKYSMGSSLNIDWTLGPDDDIVQLEMNRLQDGDFDGMVDMYNYKNSAETGMVIDGYQIETQKYVFCRQEIPFDIFFQIAKIMSTKWQWTTHDDSQPKLPEVREMDDMHTSFKQRYCNAWNWKDMVWQNWSVRNFITDDVSKVIIKDVIYDEQKPGAIVVIYEVDGVQYNTNNLSVNVSEVKKEKVIVVNNVRVVDYSDKAIAVVGNTYEIREELKSIGGKFNKFLKIDGETIAGWIFSKSKASDVSNLLIDYSQK